MWRSFFLAIGVYCCLLGAQCLAVDRMVLNLDKPPVGGALMQSFEAPRSREFVPPDWAPWTLLSAGAVTILYSFTIPRRTAKPS